MRIIDSGGYLPLGGSERRYLDLFTGKEVSRREAERRIRELDETGRELRAMAALQKRSGTIVRDYLEKKGLKAIDELKRDELKELREVFQLLKKRESEAIDTALRRIGRRRDDEIPTS